MADVYDDKVAELGKNPDNNRCLDCNIPNTQWTSVTYGIFLCLDCASIHRSLGVNTSFVKSVNMDGWGKKEYLFLKLGGNEKFKQVLKKYDLLDKEINELYFEKSVKSYGERLKSLVFEELGVSEEDYENTQVKRKVEKINIYTNRYYEPSTPTVKEESLQNKIFGTLNVAKSSFLYGIREVKNKTFEYGEKFGKNVILPTTKLLKAQTSNLSGMWKQEPKKEKEEERNYMRFDDEEVEDMSKWD
ncbi:hypothetical protein P3W45_000095 [Vairimorpha bombi]|jgi:ADP-ribosylation factor GTPase-activating protein 1